MDARHRIVLIHATPVAVDPIRQAFERDWPEVEHVNILDDSLSSDRALSDELTEALSERIVGLARYGRNLGAAGILFTCSAFGSAIERAAGLLDVPVLKPNEAMFEEALKRGPNLGMIATFAPSIAGMEEEFASEARNLNPDARLTSVLAEGAMAALKAGDVELHNKLVAAKAHQMPKLDAIMLAHFSTSRAAPEARLGTSVPILTSPETAIAKLRRLVAA